MQVLFIVSSLGEFQRGPFEYAQGFSPAILLRCEWSLLARSGLSGMSAQPTLSGANRTCRRHAKINAMTHLDISASYENARLSRYDPAF